MMTLIICWVCVRIVGIPIALNYIYNDITTIFWFYPLTWSISTVVLTIFLFTFKWCKDKDNHKELEEVLDSNIDNNKNVSE